MFQRIRARTLRRRTALVALACSAPRRRRASAPAPPAPASAPAPRSPAPAAPSLPAAAPDAVARRSHVRDLLRHLPRRDGCGDGPLSASLDPKPAKHCDGNYMNALTDEYLFQVVKQGGAAVGKSPLMAPWGGTLTDAQIRDVVAFVRSLAH